jgi:hypothetical protein
MLRPTSPSSDNTHKKKYKMLGRLIKTLSFIETNEIPYLQREYKFTEHVLIYIVLKIYIFYYARNFWQLPDLRFFYNK